MAVARAQLVLTLMMSAAASLSGQQPAAPAVSDSARVAQGKRLFEGKGLCFSCHGKAGEGLLGPTTNLVDRAFAHTDGTALELVALIKSGVDAARSKSGQIMPPRGGSRLSDAEVVMVVAYVKELHGRRSAD